MLKFVCLGVPVTVQWSFWIVMALLGGAAGASSPRQIWSLILFLAAAFISVLVHELGHTTAMKHYGERGLRITLYAMGGLAKSASGWRGQRESIVISLAGPAFGLGLALLSWLLYLMTPAGWAHHFLTQMLVINIVWSILNLLPIYPLDGGQALMAWMGQDKANKVYRISMITAGIVAAWQLATGNLFNGVAFGMFAYNNYQAMNHGSQVDWMRP